MTIEISTLLAEVDEPTPRGIAAAVSMLIRTGELPPGARLPTVRDVAAALGVSPATVSHAWQALTGAGLVRSRGRAGTFVLEPATPWLTRRSRDLATRAPGHDATAVRLDLGSGLPDPLLLPDIRPSLERMAPSHATVSTYLQPPLLPELVPVLRDLWPYEPPALTVVDGALDGVQRALAEVTRFSDAVIVESPGFPLLLDLLARMNLRAVPVEMDAQGLEPQSFARALEARPTAVVLQPRAHNPTGVSMTRMRAEQLAAMLSAHEDLADCVVIEDDHAGAIAVAAPVSVGTHLPERTIRVLGFSKSHGPDLRIAALSGPARVVERLIAGRVLGPGWTSQMIQGVLVDLLTQREPVAQVRRARHTYWVRQRELTAALARLGVSLAPADGLNMWLPVADEQAAQVRLAAHGIRVSLGGAFLASEHRARADVVGATEPHRSGAGPFSGPHVRVSVGMLREDIPQVAATLAAAASG